MRTLDAFEKELARQIIKRPLGTMLPNLLGKHLEGVLIQVEFSKSKAHVLMSKSEADNFVVSGELDNIYRKIISAVNLLELLKESKYIVIAQAAHHIDDPFTFGRGIDIEDKDPFTIPDDTIISMLIDYLNRNIYPTQALTDYVNNGFTTPEDRRHNNQIRITAISIFFTALIGVISIIMNISSLNISNKNAACALDANKIRMGLSIRQQEQRLYDMTFKDKQLMAFFADPDYDKKPFETADQYIKLLLNKNESTKWKAQYKEWDNVSNLLEIIYQPNDDFHNPAKVRLRKAYDMAEHLLYMLNDSHVAYKKGLLSKEDYDTWMPYIDDAAPNPLFLSAICFGHSSGYLTEDFARYLKERILNNKQNSKVVDVIYKEMIDPDWVNRLGKREYIDFIQTSKTRE